MYKLLCNVPTELQECFRSTIFLEINFELFLFSEKYRCLLAYFPGHLHLIDADRLGWWLCERQLPSGGLNGRPEKLPDVCYSWWVLSALAILGRLHWIDKKRLVSKIHSNLYRIVLGSLIVNRLSFKLSVLRRRTLG